ncbi:MULTISPECIES: hypothetical protein [Paenibacillus]|uniref:hypothetical protein n=1 Tax=Paenibacillus TaxID=44249 RepID=UPI0022B8AA51|nr:hypothetical protein [Paenibacillus caseinilyticus]MCZ8522327.1 hypothetical protein [Paenibacillus caseinilyticus]
MSQFSNSFHLKTSDPTKAVTLLNDAQVTGYVYEEHNGWVTFAAEYKGRHIDELLSEYNPGILVHYVYLEDHMWTLTIYNKDELVFHYKADWAGSALLIEKDLFDLEFLEELVLQQGNSTSGLEPIFDFKDSPINAENPPAYLIAQRLGLSHFEYVSPDYLSNLDEEQLEEEGIVAVGLV